MFLARLLGALDTSGVAYCVVGGLAVNLHGIPRTTYDVDLVVARNAANLARTEALLRGLGLTPRIPVKLADFADAAHCETMHAERNLIAVTFTNASNPLEEVDVLVCPPIDPDALVARSTLRQAGTLQVHVVALEDLLSMKRAAGREQDLRDVEYLERLRK